MDRKYIFALCGALVLSAGVVGLAFLEQDAETMAEPTIPIYYYGERCPSCKEVERFLIENDIASKLAFEKKEVWNNSGHAKEMAAREKTCGITREESGVPFVYFEGQCYIGTPKVESFFREQAGLSS